MPISNKYPPKFDKSLLYPAEYNLENLDIPSELSFVDRTGKQITAPWGERPLGEYFNIYFPPSNNSGVPVLSYGKHYFLLSFTPTAPNNELPRLKAGSRIMFEFKDAEDTTGNRRVIFSDLTPYKGLSNYFIGYVWIKQDPIRTYENIIGGQGTLNIVGTVETTNPNWANKPNIRTSIPISLDLTGTNPNLGYSPLLFQNTTASLSQGVDITEEQGTDGNNPSQSYAVISASKLDTYGGELKFINVSCLVSSSVVDGDNEFKPLQVHNMKTGDNIVYENNIHPDYSTGISPISEKWKVHIPRDILARGPHDPDGDGNDEYEKIKFRLTYANSANSIAQDLFNSQSIDVQVDYPSGSNDWIEWTGSSNNMSGISLMMGTQVIGQNLQDGIHMTPGEDRDGNKTVNFDLFKGGLKQKSVMTIGDSVETNADTNRNNKATASVSIGSTSASISSSTNASILGGTSADIKFSNFSTIMGTSGSLIQSGAKSSIIGGHQHTIHVGSNVTNEANMVMGGQNNQVLGTQGALVYQSMIQGGQSNTIDIPDSNAAVNASIIGSVVSRIAGGKSTMIMSSENCQINGNGLVSNNLSSTIIGSQDVHIGATPRTIVLGIDGPFSASAADTTYVQNLDVLGSMSVVGAISSSIISSSIIYSSGSNIFGDEDTDTHQFFGNITASGFISASGYISATGNITGSNISASGNMFAQSSSFTYVETTGNISASGQVFAHDFHIDRGRGDYLFSSNDTVGLSIISHSANEVIMQYDKNKSISFATPLHAGKDIEGDPGFFVNLPISSSHPMNIDSHITASGNISSSGTIYAPGMSVDLDIVHTGDSNTKIRFADDNISLTAGGNVVEIESTGIDVEGHITASGNISASGNLHYIGGVTKTDSLVVNEQGESTNDFRVESDNNAYLIFSDSSEDKVSIGRNIPSRGVARSMLHVSEDLRVDTNITASGDISCSGDLIVNHISASGNLIVSGGYGWIKSKDDGSESKLYLGANSSTGAPLMYISTTNASADKMDFSIGRYTHKWQFIGGGDTNGLHNAFEIYGQDSSANQDYSRLRLFDPDSTIRAQIHTSGSVYFNPIGPDANFGIGTNAPSNKLEVNGDISQSGNFITEGHITSSGNISASGGTIIAQSASFGDGDKMFIHADVSNSDIVANNNHFRLRTNRNQDTIKFQPNNTDVMIVSASGNVGIGDTAPTEPLVVNGIISASGVIKGSPGHYFGNNNDTSDNYIIYHAASDAISIQSQDININGANGVGIGTGLATNNLSKLQVHGDMTVNSHITASGNISSSGDIVGHQYHMTHHNMSSVGTNQVYIPLISTTEATSTSYTRQWVAPFDGSLEKIRMYAASAGGDTVCRLYVNKIIALGASSTSDTVSVSATTTATFTFSSGNTYSAGDLIRVTIDATNSLGDTNMTCIWKYNTTTL